MRIKKDTIEKMQAFIDSLPEESKSKCKLCNETLTHIVHTISVKTGAPIRTVSRALAADINIDAVENDKITGGALYHRILKKTGKIKVANSKLNKNENPYQDANYLYRREEINTRRKQAIKRLGINYLLYLNTGSVFPDELVAWIKRGRAKQHHPDSGGSNKLYQQFEEDLKALQEKV